jgi:hypothetical protein
MEESRCDDAGNGCSTLHSVGGYSADASSRGSCLQDLAPSGFDQLTDSVTCMREGELDVSSAPDRYPNAVVWLRFGGAGPHSGCPYRPAFASASAGG